ncbi:MAG: 3-hydroxyacyl-CoA dehydrogenase NAD-binding domain-containing protein [Candidatus Hodarchaeales archaeon]
MKTIGVLGAGIMANGIALVSAVSSYKVILHDIN